MAISKELKEKARMTRDDGAFTLQLDEPTSLGLLTQFAQDVFPGVSLEDIGVWPSDQGELVVSIRQGGLAAN